MLRAKGIVADGETAPGCTLTMCPARSTSAPAARCHGPSLRHRLEAERKGHSPPCSACKEAAMAIPVYAFTGFLDAGKTKFIQETLEDERFNAGERTLLLVCEEGEEEYDLSAYPSPACLSRGDRSGGRYDRRAFTSCSKKHHAERVVVELNGMHAGRPISTRKCRRTGRSRRRSCLPTARRILAYNANMRSPRGGQAHGL